MKLMNLSSLVLMGAIATSSLAQAGISTNDIKHVRSSEKKCAFAINNYLNYRYETVLVDAYKVQTLEKQVDSTCVGYQIKLVESDGVMTGIVELAD